MGRARTATAEATPAPAPVADAIPAEDESVAAAIEAAGEVVDTSDDAKVEAALAAALNPSPEPPVTQPSSKEPPLAPLETPKGEKPLPHFGTPRPIPADSVGVVPRVVHQLERAPVGYCRYKIACRNYHPQPVRYILSRPDAGGEVEARRCYLESVGLGRLLREMARNGRDEIEPPALSVTKLAD